LSTSSSVSDASVIGETGPPGRDDVDARRRDLVLERQQQAVADRRLGGSVVGVAGLAEAAGGGADQDEGVPALSREAAAGQERGGEVAVDRLAPALERQLGHRDVLARPHAGVGDAEVERAGGGEQLVHLRLVAQVGAEREPAERLGRLAVAVVVGDDLDALRRQLARDRLADAARRARDERPLAREAEVHQSPTTCATRLRPR
jgi:hypothetical protein